MLLNCGVGEDFWESPGLQQVHPKGNKSWVFTGRTDIEGETPILWPRNVKSWLIWKDPDVGKDWRRRRRGRQRMRLLNGIPDSMEIGLGWWWTGRPGMLWFMGSQRIGHDWATELIWTEQWIRTACQCRDMMGSICVQLLSPNTATAEAQELRACAPRPKKPPQWEARALQWRVAPILCS